MVSSEEELLERSGELAALEARLAEVGAGRRGRLALVAGEAGAGKTALLRAFCAGPHGARVLWGGCDPLHTPRPLGPLLDIAAQAGGELAALAESSAAPAAMVAALGDELERRPPAIVVLEDVHWADEATLDVLRLLARRIDGLPALVVASYRDDLDRAHPLRVLLGELPGARAIARVRVAPLSVAAVAALAGERDAAELHRRTGGNPFYVTEVLAAGGAGVPDSVRDAVLARAARLEPAARTLLEAVAIVPQRAELWLLEAMAGDTVAELERCLASGMLRAEADAVAFRHEIARVAIEATLPPGRRLALHRAALAALTAAPERRPDLARLAHHADAAGDVEAVLRHAPAAGERAAALHSHREAAAQFARALRHASGLPSARRAELLERRAYECYLTDDVAEAVAARRAALEVHRERGDRRREGDAHRWLSRLAWFEGDKARAEAEAERAVALLEAEPPGRELAMAYSNLAQLRMLDDDRAAAAEWGSRAIALAEELGETEILAHALNNVGSAEFLDGAPEGRAKLERSLRLALEAGLEEHVARAYTNLGTAFVRLRDYAAGDARLRDGVAYSREHDLDAWVLYMSGWQARSALEQGRWEPAAQTAAGVLAHPLVAVPSRIQPLVVLGTLRARRGDPDPWAPLDEASALADGTGELQRLAPVAAARAEARWLAGEPEAAVAETEEAYALARRLGDVRPLATLAVWRRRCGRADALGGATLPEPERLELAGEALAAAAAWDALGCPYEAALARAGGDREPELRHALAALQRLGARPAADRVARRLRERGARDIRRGPRAATRRNPGELTARELEVVALVAEGLRNAEIAARLFVSEKTVDHHVSAILRKLGVHTRGEAAAHARRLGIVER
jgi:DNA-binding CsgD family transcriptional regulator/tetratricopeptide (TPR) repeat protein